jgi:hypothetical protein
MPSSPAEASEERSMLQAIALLNGKIVTVDRVSRGKHCSLPMVASVRFVLVSEARPGSILRQVKHATLYLDPDSAMGLQH